MAELRDERPGAFRKLVEEHQHKVINICYRFVHDRTEAEDLAQETFVEVHRSLAGFRARSSLSTWIHQIAVSKSLDFIRKLNREKHGGKIGRMIRLNQEAVDVPSPDSEAPDAQLEQKHRQRVLQQALNQLPKNQRIAFVLSKYDGMKYEEIAGILKTTLSSVESLIHRARKNLQRILHKYYSKNL